jgi:iron(III) transport system permease protein
VPGGVIAVGLLVPFAAFDNALDAFMRARFRPVDRAAGHRLDLAAGRRLHDPLSGRGAGAWDGGQATVPRNMEAAARSLGQTPLGTLRRVYLPILRPSLLTALLIVFVDVMKELPATLILRPFNFDTLAVQAYRLAADERLGGRRRAQPGDRCGRAAAGDPDLPAGRPAQRLDGYGSPGAGPWGLAPGLPGCIQK